MTRTPLPSDRHDRPVAVTGSSGFLGRAVVARLYDGLARLYGHRNRVWNFPPALVASAARLVLGGRADSLLGDAAFDGSAFAASMAWTPPFSMDEGLRITVAGNDAEA